MFKDFDDSFNRNLTVSSAKVFNLGINKVRGEVQMRVTTRDLGAANEVVVRGKLLDESNTEWTDIGTLTGNTTEVLDISTYDQVQVECTVYDSTPGKILMSAFFFKLSASTPTTGTYVGTLYKITTDLTIAAFYEYRVRQLILSGANITVIGDLIVTG